MTFDKAGYWDRRNKGLRGQIPAYGTKEQRKDNRVMAQRELKDKLKKWRKGEQPKSKAV